MKRGAVPLLVTVSHYQGRGHVPKLGCPSSLPPFITLPPSFPFRGGSPLEASWGFGKPVKHVLIGERKARASNAFGHGVKEYA